MLSKYGKWFAKTVLLICVVFLTACGSDSDGGNSSEDNANSDNSAAQVDLTGVWQVEETITGNCSGEDYPYTKISVYTGSQQGNTITLCDQLEGTTMTGTLNGYTLSFTTTIPDGSGELTISFTGTCTSDGASFSGTGEWTYAESGYTCSGTSQLTGSKTDQEQLDATGSWSGTYLSEEYGFSDSFSAEIIDNDGVLTGTISVPYIYMTDAQLEGEVNGNAITFGDIEGRITFSGIMSETDFAEGSYVYPDLDDEGSWSAIRN